MKMIRFFIRRKFRDAASGLETDEIESITVDVPEIEAVLTDGGYGENGYDHRLVVGAEVVGGA
jgi:hypothetical protein